MIKNKNNKQRKEDFMANIILVVGVLYLVFVVISMTLILLQKLPEEFGANVVAPIGMIPVTLCFVEIVRAKITEN